MGENSVMIWNIPSNLRSGAGVVTSHEMRAMTLEAIRLLDTVLLWLSCTPRLAELDIRDAIFIAKSQRKRTKSIKCAPIEPNVFLESLLDKGTLVHRYLCFAGHFQCFDGAVVTSGLRHHHGK